MSYTQLALLGIVVVVLLDLFVFRTRLLRRRAFWAAYAIVVFFQLVTNGILTGLRIVRYDGAAIVGSSTPVDAPPPFLGDGRIAFAPFEDLLFGFALVVLTQVLWVWLGRRGVQRTPSTHSPRDSSPTSHRFTERTASSVSSDAIGTTTKNRTSSSGRPPGNTTPSVRSTSNVQCPEAMA